MSNEPANRSEDQSQLFDNMRSTLGELAMSINQKEVDLIKGCIWKLVVKHLVETYGIKDTSVPAKVSECFRMALNEESVPGEMRATIQDALAEFRSEYSDLIV